jgi:hypothetical protein
MLTKRYMTTVKNLPSILQKLVDGTAPPKFTIEHLQGLGFKSSADRAIIPVLKDLGFLSEDGVPTQRYHAYRDKSQSKHVMGEALKDAYEDLFHINANPTESDRSAIHGKFKSAHNVSDAVADKQVLTFLALLKLADLGPGHFKKKVEKEGDGGEQALHTKEMKEINKSISLRYNIEIHLPATKDVDVYNAIFKSLRSHLLS